MATVEEVPSRCSVELAFKPDSAHDSSPTLVSKTDFPEKNMRGRELRVLSVVNANADNDS